MPLTEKTYDPNSPEARRLIRALALGDRFQFLVWPCERPATVKNVAPFLAEQASALRGAPFQLVQLDPYAHLTQHGDTLSFEFLIQEIVEPLTREGMTPHGKDAIYLIDATRAQKGDKEAWCILFQRMNELRNTIATQTSCSLILACPSILLAEFGRRASDFWSIRSGIFSIAEAIEETQTDTLRSPRADKVNIDLNKWLPESRPPLLGLSPDTVSTALRQEIETEEKNAASEILNIEFVKAQASRLTQLAQHETKRGAFLQAESAYAQAAQLLRNAIQQDKDESSLLEALSIALGDFAVFYSNHGDINKTAELSKEALEIDTKLTENHPDAPLFQGMLANSLLNCGHVSFDRGMFGEALGYYERSLVVIRKLVDSDQHILQWRSFLADALIGRGDALTELGSHEDSKQVFNDALDVLQIITENYPDNLSFEEKAAYILRRLGALESMLGNLEMSIRYYNDALQLLRKLRKKVPDNDNFQSELSIVLAEKSKAEMRRGDFDMAYQYAKEALTTQRALSSKKGWDLFVQLNLSARLGLLGNILMKKENLEEAKASFEEALLIARELRKTAPERVNTPDVLASSLDNMGSLYLEMIDLPNAIHYFTEEVALRRQLASFAPENLGWLRRLALCLLKLGTVLMGETKLDEAAAIYNESLATIEKNLTFSPDSPLYRHDWAIIKAHQAELALKRGDLEAALVTFQQSLECIPPLVIEYPDIPSYAKLESKLRNRIALLTPSQGPQQPAP